MRLAEATSAAEEAPTAPAKPPAKAAAPAPAAGEINLRPPLQNVGRRNDRLLPRTRREVIRYRASAIECSRGAQSLDLVLLQLIVLCRGASPAYGHAIPPANARLGNCKLRRMDRSCRRRWPVLRRRRCHCLGVCVRRWFPRERLLRLIGFTLPLSVVVAVLVAKDKESKGFRVSLGLATWVRWRHCHLKFRDSPTDATRLPQFLAPMAKRHRVGELPSPPT